MSHPYRIEDEAARSSRPRAELVYLASDRERQVAPARSAAQVGILGALGGVVSASAGFPQVAVGILVTTAAFATWSWKRSPGLSGLLFAVEGGELVVTARSTATVVARARLVDLLDVSLDTKSIRKVGPGESSVPAVQFIDSKVGPEIDVARIVLSVANRPSPIRLTDAFLAHMDSVEWLGKIRSFLRQQGWTPNDERDVPDSA